LARRRYYVPIVPEWQLGFSRQDFTTLSLLDIAEVMEQLKVKGCVRLSAVDAVRSKVMLYRRSTLDPATLFGNLIERRNTHKVDAHVLALRDQAGRFLHDFLETIIADTDACGAADASSDHVIVLISDALIFPESKQLTPLALPAGLPRPRFYFFRLTVREYMRHDGFGRGETTMFATSPDDQVVRLLANLNARRFDLSQPKDFEKALPRFLEELGNGEDALPAGGH
jgi:hypothetical protein